MRTSKLLAAVVALAGLPLVVHTAMHSQTAWSSQATDVHKTLAAESGWAHHETHDDGLVVYAKPVPELGLQAFRGIKTMRDGVDADVLFSLIHNVDDHDKISGSLHESTVLWEDKPNSVHFFQVLKKPSGLPVTERYWFNEGVSERNINGEAGHHKRTWSSFDPAKYPEAQAYVSETYPDAIPVGCTYGTWETLPQADGSLVLVYTTLSHPGGKIPDWVINTLSGRTLPDNMRSFERAAWMASK
jgi:hypothetical protein